MRDSLPTAAELRAAFERHREVTVGLEEELMLLDASTLDLAPHAAEVVEGLGDARFKIEMPAAQLEIVTVPHATVAEAAAELARARADLAEAVEGRFRLAGAGAHPFASGTGRLNRGPRYEAIEAEYAAVARRQLVFGLHVHVAVPGADRALAVYNALRSYLPLLAALSANAPFYEGADSGLASVRPRLSGLLPRQGVPPALESFEAYADALRWCGFEDPRQWWWELRLHPLLGTVEVRVPDTQTTVEETAAIAEAIHGLVTRLAERPEPVYDSWRIDQNRWSACRHGVEGEMTDLATGERRPTRELLAELGAQPTDLAGRQRTVAAERGQHGLVDWLAARFLG
ncbi:MAG TPA: YbdK family carboxylate-amine ligase [Solirubrobacteraceae bacterium]|nr:YbdK family carboxylate-amine ligase [Solirubrobacteraceae bacterium]